MSPLELKEVPIKRLLQLHYGDRFHHSLTAAWGREAPISEWSLSGPKRSAMQRHVALRPLRR